jgi:hypothetical protein
MQVSVYKRLRFSHPFDALPTYAALGAARDYNIALRTPPILFCDSLLADLWLPDLIATMSGKSTFPGDNILDKMRHAGNDFTFDDIVPNPPPTTAKKLPDLPANLDKLSVKALEDLAKQN